MSNCNIIIVGAGGHGRVCADVARRAGRNVTAFCDPAFSQATEILGIPVLANSERELFDDWPDATELFVAIGDNARRLAIASDACRRGIPLAVLIDPSAVISPSATLGDGVIAMPGVVVNAEAFVGRAALINTSAIVEHGARVGQGGASGPRRLPDRRYGGRRTFFCRCPGHAAAGCAYRRRCVRRRGGRGHPRCRRPVPARPVRELRLIEPVRPRHRLRISYSG